MGDTLTFCHMSNELLTFSSNSLKHMQEKQAFRVGQAHFFHSSTEILTFSISWFQHFNNTTKISMMLNNSIRVMEHVCHTSNEILTFSISWFQNVNWTIGISMILNNPIRELFDCAPAYLRLTYKCNHAFSYLFFVTHIFNVLT